MEWCIDMKRRIFIDAREDERCLATILLRDKSTAQCGRKRAVGKYCKQHEKILSKQN
jgi:hypothetical protein